MSDHGLFKNGSLDCSKCCGFQFLINDSCVHVGRTCTGRPQTTRRPGSCFVADLIMCSRSPAATYHMITEDIMYTYMCMRMHMDT